MSDAVERIGQYRLEGHLGSGGMGDVYEAFDEKLERKVAIKLLPVGRPVTDNASARMLREARAASALDHPAIVTVHEIGEHEGRGFIVMERVDGETFSDLLARRGPLPVSEALDLVEQVANALDAAHTAGIVHRDIKSANLMVDRRGMVRVLDFGLSKRLAASPGIEVSDPDRDELSIDGLGDTLLPSAEAHSPTLRSPPLSLNAQLTAAGARMGTPGYAAL